MLVRAVAIAALALAAVASFSAVVAQVPVPNKPPGFTYGGGSPAAGVQLETYVDLLCPDSKSAFPGLRGLTKHYAPEDFRLNVVLFPLPYHQHAFAAAEATYTILAALGEEHFDLWLETIYANQEIFWNKATKDLSPVQVSDQLFALAQATFPGLTRAQWDAGMSGYGGTFADEAARISWKYACSRAKTGTPLYSLNGVPFDDAGADWSVDAWREVLDPLVAANKRPVTATMTTENAARHPQAVGGLHRRIPDRQVVRLSHTQSLSAVCNDDRRRPCEFVPGQAMCCASHEACVLRVGCRALA